MIGTIVAQYEILEKLGSGGMGIVYKALDSKLNRFVALKFLPQDLDVSKTDKERFLREAQSASALDHLNICTVYEIGETDEGQMFIAMAYYDGDTLKKIMANGPLSVKQSLDFALQIAHGLGKAHSQGIIHRDVKPANVIVTTEGIAKLLDFGLAKSPDAALTRPGTILGTVSYMSPEQTQSQAIDHRTDIWSLGVVIYEMLTGVSPFKKNNEAATIYAIVYKEPEQITALRQDVPTDLQAIIEKCLAKNPDGRFQDIETLIKALQLLEPLPDTRPGTPPRLPADIEVSETQTMPRPIRELEAEKHGVPLTQSTPRPARRKPQAQVIPRTASKRISRAALSVFIFSILAAAVLFVYFTDLRKTIFGLFELKESPAVLFVESTPVGATVFLNGDSIGITPLVNYRLQPGSANIILQKAGFMQKDSSLLANAGKVAHLRFSLMPAPPLVDASELTNRAFTQQLPATKLKQKSGQRTTDSKTDQSQIPTDSRAKLTLQAIPYGSVRILNNSPIKSVNSPVNFELAAGAYTIEFQHPKHGTMDTTVVLQAGERRNLTC
ncbi:MAG: protein kinase, partial [bacterium]